MPTFTSGRYPQLQVNTNHGTVRFVEGRAEATDEQASVLRAMDAEYQLVEENAEEAEAHGTAPSTPQQQEVPAPEPEPEVVDEVSAERPAKSAPKQAWIDWAVANGMSADQAEDLTKDQLIELAAQLAEE
ncbi:hypothetical protein [Nonomuraea dietziae]|uniref:hypothetical protein n=1 Tax=Nonomuraea dietziae TaxID=65515 RepID=UPI0033D8C23C